MDVSLQDVSINAFSAWVAFGAQDYAGLEKRGNMIYNYFVHHPEDLLKLDGPLLIGKVFQVCLGFQEPDEDIQEVRAENAFLCFSQAFESGKTDVHDEAAARLMLLLIRDQSHLIGKVEQACRGEHPDPYSFMGMMSDGMPMDMPMATNTKMLFTAYYLYDSMIEPTCVSNEFVNAVEKNAFEQVRQHVLENCAKMGRTSPERMAELGNIVFDRICKRLRQDILLYSNKYKNQ